MCEPQRSCESYVYHTTLTDESWLHDMEGCLMLPGSTIFEAVAENIRGQTPRKARLLEQCRIVFWMAALAELWEIVWKMAGISVAGCGQGQLLHACAAYWQRDWKTRGAWASRDWLIDQATTTLQTMSALTLAEPLIFQCLAQIEEHYANEEREKLEPWLFMIRLAKLYFFLHSEDRVW